MAGVGDKAFLLFIALGDRTHDPPGKEEQQQKHGQCSGQRDADAGVKEAAEGRQFALAVEEQQQFLAAAGGAAPAVSVRKALRLSGGVNALRHRRSFFFRQRGQIVEPDARKAAGRVEPRGKIAALVGQLTVVPAAVGKGAFSFPVLRRDPAAFRPGPGSPVLLAEHLPGEFAPVVRQDLQRIVGLAYQTAVVEEVDRADQHEQHEKHGDDRRGDEFFLQLPDHERTSR